MSQPRPLDPGMNREAHADLNRLCSKCVQLSQRIQNFEQTCSRDWSNPSEYLCGHHESSIALAVSAREGCHLCTLISQVREAVITERTQTMEQHGAPFTKEQTETIRSSYRIKIRGHVEVEEDVDFMNAVATKLMSFVVHANRPKARVSRYFGMEVVLPVKVDKPWVMKKAKLDIGYGPRKFTKLANPPKNMN